MFFSNSLAFFDDLMDVGNLISGSSAFSKPSLNIWKFRVHVLLKPSLENFENYFATMWNECNCAVVGTFFGIAFLWDWNENWPFSVLWLLLSFPDLLAYWVQHFHSIIFQDLKQLSWNSVTSTSFVRSDAYYEQMHLKNITVFKFIMNSTLIASSFRTSNSSAGIPSPPLVLFIVVS